MWNWLRGGSAAAGAEVEVVADRVWLDEAPKLQGLAKAVGEGLRDARLVIATAHFPRTLASVEETLRAAGVAFEASGGRLHRGDLLRLADAADGPRVIAALAEHLPTEGPPPGEGPGPGTLAVVVAERHLLRARDEAIVAAARGLGRRGRVEFHMALSDPLLGRFAGPWVREVLIRLGLGPAEPIVDRGVGRQIKAAQAKLAGRVVGDSRADSAAEWLERNLGAEQTR